MTKCQKSLRNLILKFEKHRGNPVANVFGNSREIPVNKIKLWCKFRVLKRIYYILLIKIILKRTLTEQF